MYNFQLSEERRQFQEMQGNLLRKVVEEITDSLSYVKA